ncbi:MAG: hypothetical protein SRB2_03136 [Desulfobacteraceae bacterium Eth-SRB2]|nr:MAG: hypothetical protein SRB2_03136 [Desulfobacteraceae bacterium Eth-SRB2]
MASMFHKDVTQKPHLLHISTQGQSYMTSKGAYMVFKPYKMMGLFVFSIGEFSNGHETHFVSNKS